MGRIVRASLEILRLAVRREQLPDAPAETPEARRRGLSLRAVLAPEALPEDPVPPPRPRGSGLLRAMFPAETLPLDPPEARPHRGRWLAWLFAPERLDSHQEP